MKNFGHNTQVLNLLAVAAITTTAASAWIDLKDFEGEIAIIADVSDPVAGTNPTLAIKVQESTDGDADVSDVADGAFTAVAASGGVQKKVLDSDGLKRFIRIHRTIGGTDSPEYLVSVKGTALKKYR